MVLRSQNSYNPNSFPTDVPIISYLPQKKRFVLIRDKEAGTD